MQSFSRAAPMYGAPTMVSRPVTETIVSQPVVKEQIIEDLIIDVNIERPTVSGGIDALGLKPTQVEPLQPTFVQAVNETIVTEAPRTIMSQAPVQYMSAPMTSLTSTLNRSFQSVPTYAAAPQMSF